MINNSPDNDEEAMHTRERPFSLTNGIALIILMTAYGISLFHIARQQSKEMSPEEGEGTLIRIVHNIKDTRVESAFAELARLYEEKNPGKIVRIQAIPERAYDQWITTQFLGGTAPDIVQTMDRFGRWSTLAQEHLVSLSGVINEPNPYNGGTPMEGVSLRDTYIDGMEGGYFPHLMEFYSFPLTLNTSRIFYNKELLHAATGNDAPPRDFQEWLRILEEIRNYAKSKNRVLYPMAVSRDDNLYNLYFPIFTAGMIDDYDHQLWGVMNPQITLYGLHTNTLDLKHKRIEVAFSALRKLARNFQPTFISDMSDQTRFLFVQQRAAMVVGNTRDLMVYNDLANFPFGVFDFPLPGKSDSEFGKYFVGPVAESPLGTFSFGVNARSRKKDDAIDFLQFCASLSVNEDFCRTLNWYPVIRGATTHRNLEIFEPRVEGVRGYPDLRTPPSADLYFEQNFPLFLSGHMDFEHFMDGLISVWLTTGVEDLQRRDRGFANNINLTEFNISRSRARMLFEEAGELKTGNIMGSRTPYELGLEVINILYHGISSRQFIWNQLADDNYEFPPPGQDERRYD